MNSPFWEDILDVTSKPYPKDAVLLPEVLFMPLS